MSAIPGVSKGSIWKWYFSGEKSSGKEVKWKIGQVCSRGKGAEKELH